jgi:competence CoiA-like predicted nuclease
MLIRAQQQAAQTTTATAADIVGKQQRHACPLCGGKGH